MIYVCSGSRPPSSVVYTIFWHAGLAPWSCHTAVKFLPPAFSARISYSEAFRTGMVAVDGRFFLRLHLAVTRQHHQMQDGPHDDLHKHTGHPIQILLFTGGAWSKARSHLDHCLLIGWTYKWPIRALLKHELIYTDSSWYQISLDPRYYAMMHHTWSVRSEMFWGPHSICWYLFLKPLFL